MKCSSKNFSVGILLVTVTVFFLFGCASKSKTTQPEGTAEQQKPASEPSAKGQETATPAPAPATAPAASPASSSPPPKTSEVSQPTAQRTTEIVPSFVNLRQGPSMDSKIVKVLKKGTKLTVLQEKGGWLRIQLEDGTEGWVGKAMTSEGAKPKSP